MSRQARIPPKELIPANLKNELESSNAQYIRWLPRDAMGTKSRIKRIAVFLLREKASARFRKTIAPTAVPRASKTPCAYRVA